MPKNRYTRAIDIPNTHAFNAGGNGGGTIVPSVEPPAQAAPGAPTNLSLSTTIERSAATASARIAATWYPPAGVAPSNYIIQWSTSSTFPDGSTSGQLSDDEATTIIGLTPATLYYVRVAAIVAGQQGAWSDTASTTTASDTTPPNAPTSQAGTFNDAGGFVVTYTPSTSANARDTEIVIYSDAAKTITYATLYNVTGRLIWTAAENLAATSGAGDPTLYAELRARSWGGIFSSAVNTGTVTKTGPAGPTISVDFTGMDAVYTITPPADTAAISFVADTGVTARRIGIVGRYVYPYDTNRLDHSGTPDPVLSYAFTVIDALNQVSAASSGTATNAAPSAPTVTLIGGQNQLVCTVTSAPAADFAAYEYVWKKDTVTVLTVESASSEQQYAAQAGDEGSHSWTCTVRQKDAFGQYSSGTTSSTVVLDALTIAYLRSGLIFTDSVGNSVATLAVLKDGVTASGGISYAA